MEREPEEEEMWSIERKIEKEFNREIKEHENINRRERER